MCGSLGTLAVVTLVLPNFTVTVVGPYFSRVQLVGVGVISLALWAVFVFVQTCLPGMAGFGGLVVLLWLLTRLRGPAREWLPGAVLLAALVVVGVAVHPEGHPASTDRGLDRQRQAENLPRRA